jgi:hypothetical protein
MVKGKKTALRHAIRISLMASAISLGFSTGVLAGTLGIYYEESTPNILYQPSPSYVVVPRPTPSYVIVEEPAPVIIRRPQTVQVVPYYSGVPSSPYGTISSSGVISGNAGGGVTIIGGGGVPPGGKQ